MSTCSVSECDRTVIARGYCQGHYARWRSGAPLDAPLRTYTPGGKPCVISDCGRHAVSSGLCNTHRLRALTGTDLDAPIATKFVTDDLLERLRFYAPAGAPDECWEWTAARNKGYGAIAVHGSRMRPAHTVAWELHHGQPLPKGMVIRHTCDNPPCVNPAHLLLGTYGDNNQDRVERGPSFKGEGNAMVKLTDDAVRAIRQLCANGMLQRIAAEQFGIKQANVSAIVLRKTWKHV